MDERIAPPGFEIGMIGLGTMGRNLLLNLASRGFPGAGYDRDPAQRTHLEAEARTGEAAADSIHELVQMLRIPRVIMLLVPAGPVVDMVIDELLPHIQPGDLVIDGGNSYFKDTSARMRRLNAKGIEFLGVGISGGEEGARLGPSIMPGGSKPAYEYVRRMLEAVAAEVDGEPCVTYLGPDAAGHFVKMVHNGIEYAIMELIAEAYDLMKRGLGMNDDELHETFVRWNEGRLKSFLIEITAQIFQKTDDKTGRRLIDEILGVARQKGTGMWTSRSAMELHVPVPSIDSAVMMRDFSALELLRQKRIPLHTYDIPAFKGERKELIARLEDALYAGMIVSYAQGMHLLAEASQEYEYGTDLEATARIWRGGCIIRSALLEDVRSAFRRDRSLTNLLADTAISELIGACEPALRSIVCDAAQMRIPAPGLMSVLSYIDTFRSGWIPANLIQAQRDYFGAHTYERIDEDGVFHTQWNK
ncbi:MAG: NADP-dependent phosphogluconate dehydrogenase [Acidobacteriota bacterium]